MKKKLLLDKQYIESSVERIPFSGCWIWIRTKITCRKGYARYCGWSDKKRVSIRLHRLAFELWHRPLLEGECVLHRCDVRSCVNPDHLFVGSSSDNIADMVNKNRQAKGEAHGLSKLTAAQVIEVLRSQENNTSLGRKYGVSKGTIRSIRKRIHWREISDMLEAA